MQIVTLTCAGGSRAYSKRQERGIGKAGKVVEIFRCGFWKTVTPKLILGVPDVEIHMSDVFWCPEGDLNPHDR